MVRKYWPARHRQSLKLLLLLRPFVKLVAMPLQGLSLKVLVRIYALCSYSSKFRSEKFTREAMFHLHMVLLHA